QIPGWYWAVQVQIVYAGGRFSCRAQPELLEAWPAAYRRVSGRGHGGSYQDLCLLPGTATDHDGDRPPSRTARGRYPEKRLSRCGRGRRTTRRVGFFCDESQQATV